MGRYCEYNQLMEGKWQAVPLMGPADQTRVGWSVYNTEYNQRVQEARDWCETSAHGRWSVGQTRVRRLINGSNTYIYVKAFLFKGPNDALLFKLAFGGT